MGIANHVERRVKPARSVIDIVSEQKRIAVRDSVTCNRLMKLWLGKLLCGNIRGEECRSQRLRGIGAKATETQQNAQRGS
jgi:hypothetical protein